MSQQPSNSNEHEYVKLMHCPAHETFHLCIGRASVRLTPRELLLLGAAINRWWDQHPEQVEKLQPFEWLSSNERES